MPSLNWPTKNIPQPVPEALELDSVVYPQGRGYLDALAQGDRIPENRLVLGDNLAVMAALLRDYEARIPLIYADPPFFTNRRFSARIGRGEDSRKPQEWQLAHGYPDDWRNLDDYLNMLYPRLVFMHRLLSPDGTLYLHLDWHANAYARILLDEIFGPDRLLNEIVWVYHGPSPIRSAFNRKHDTLLVYTKSDQYTFNADRVRVPYDPNTVRTFASSLRAGFGKVPDLERGKVPEDWWYFPVVARLHNERTGYPTQKPQALLERIILASSHPGDLVADFFCGSGTTPLAAARLGRRFLATDLQWRAVHITSTRLLELGGEPYSIEMAGGAAVDPASGPPPNLVRQAGRVMWRQPTDGFTYWEIDPAWDGKLFRSAAQAWMPFRKQELASRLDLIVNNPDCPVKVRYVDAHGGVGQTVLPPD